MIIDGIRLLIISHFLVLFILGWFQTQVEVALAAADGDLNVAVEILMSQQVLVDHFFIYNL